MIINKFRTRWFGGGLRKNDATDLLGSRLAGFVSEDAELVDEAINRGELISAIDRSNRISRDLGRILFKYLAFVGEFGAFLLEQLKRSHRAGSRPRERART